MTLVNNFRKSQLYGPKNRTKNFRGIPDFENFNPTKVLIGDFWVSDQEDTTVNLIENNVKVYKNDIVMALVKNPGPLSYETLNNNEWIIQRDRAIGTGAKKTGVDGGFLWEQSFDNDFIFICVGPGTPEPPGHPGEGTAVWKRIQLHST